MKKIILLRHAKSSWDNTALGDHDRPLNKRGRAAVPLIAAWLTERGHLPDTVLCSSAVRTRQTVQIIRDTVPEMPAPLIEPGLYHASSGAMLDLLKHLPGTCQTVMLAAHQPGVGSLTRQLSNGREEHRCKRAYTHFPTAAAAVMEIDVGDWRNLDHGGGHFVDFAVPRELTGR